MSNQEDEFPEHFGGRVGLDISWQYQEDEGPATRGVVLAEAEGWGFPDFEVFGLEGGWGCQQKADMGDGVGWVAVLIRLDENEKSEGVIWISIQTGVGCGVGENK